MNTACKPNNFQFLLPGPVKLRKSYWYDILLFYPELWFFVKYSIFALNLIFLQKFELSPKIWIFSKNLNFLQKFEFSPKNWILPKHFELLTKILNFDLIWIFWPKFEFLTKVWIFYQNLYFWPKFEFLTKICIFDQNLNFWPKLEVLTKICIFDQNLYFWPKFKQLTNLCIFLPKNGAHPGVFTLVNTLVWFTHCNYKVLIFKGLIIRRYVNLWGHQCFYEYTWVAAVNGVNFAILYNHVRKLTCVGENIYTGGHII